MAEDTQQGVTDGAAPIDGAQPVETPAELDALFDQVATSDTPTATDTTSPESGGGPDLGDGGAGGDKTDGAADGAKADATSTPSSGSPASGAAPAASAPKANDSASPAPAKGAAPTLEGTPAPAPEKTGKLTPEEENRRLKGRIAALQRDNDALKRNGNSTPTPSPAAAPGNGPASTGKDGSAPKGIKAKLDANPKWQTVAKDYPEIAAPIEEALADLDGRQSRLDANEQQANLDRNGDIVARAHPDAGKIVQAKEFTEWLGHQPRYVVDQVKQNGRGVVDADACIDIFNRFKADTGISFTQAPNPTPANNGGASPSNDATLAARAARQNGAIDVKAGRVSQPTNGDPDDPDKLFDVLAARSMQKGKAA